jgi:hypothetical protein
VCESKVPRECLVIREVNFHFHFYIIRDDTFSMLNLGKGQWFDVCCYSVSSYYSIAHNTLK